jgi:acyl CoA:acetate/3-ketoacid CoA transferase
LLALGDRFPETGDPYGFTLLHGSGQGDSGERGLDRLGQSGLLSG